MLKLGNKMKVIDMTPKEDYQGFTNWATWNVALFCDNDESIYKDIKRAARRGTLDERYTEILVKDWYPTPADLEMTMQEFLQVDWEELAEHFNAE